MAIGAAVATFIHAYTARECRFSYNRRRDLWWYLQKRVGVMGIHNERPNATEATHETLGGSARGGHPAKNAGVGGMAHEDEA